MLLVEPWLEVGQGKALFLELQSKKLIEIDVAKRRNSRDYIAGPDGVMVLPN